MIDGLDALAHELAIRRSGWYRVKNPETGAAAYFPETAKDVDAWEDRCQAMHAAQRTIVLEPKTEPTGIRRNMIERGD